MQEDTPQVPQKVFSCASEQRPAHFSIFARRFPFSSLQLELSGMPGGAAGVGSYVQQGRRRGSTQ